MKWLALRIAVMFLALVLGTRAETLTVPDHTTSYWKLARTFLEQHEADIKASGQTIEQVIANSAKIDSRLAGKGLSGKARKNFQTDFSFGTKKITIGGKKVDRYYVLMGNVITVTGKVRKPSDSIIARQKVVTKVEKAVAQAPAISEAPTPKVETAPAPKPEVTAPLIGADLQIPGPVVFTEESGRNVMKTAASPLSIDIGPAATEITVPQVNPQPITAPATPAAPKGPAMENIMLEDPKPQSFEPPLPEDPVVPHIPSALQGADEILGSMTPPDAPPAPKHTPAVAAVSDYKEESKGSPSIETVEYPAALIPDENPDQWKYILGTVAFFGILALLAWAWVWIPKLNMKRAVKAAAAIAEEKEAKANTPEPAKPNWTSSATPSSTTAPANGNALLGKQPSDIPPPTPVILPKPKALDEKDVRIVDRTDRIQPKRSDKEHRKDLLKVSEGTIASIVATCEESLRAAEKELAPLKAQFEAAKKAENEAQERYNTAFTALEKLSPGTPDRAAKVSEVANLNTQLTQAIGVRKDIEKRFQPANRSCESLREKYTKESDRLVAIRAQLARNKAEAAPAAIVAA